MRAVFVTVLFISSTLLLMACDSVVERTEPSTSVSQEVALSNPGAIEGIRASMYGAFKDEQMATDWLHGPAALADGSFFRSNRGRHQGLNVFQRRNGIGTNVWDEAYETINRANTLVSGIQEDALPEDERNKLRAEGLFVRSLVHHHLTRIFGYDPAEGGGVLTPATGPGANNDLGTVLRLEPTLNVEAADDKPRATVPEVYDQLVADLNEAINLFSGLPDGAREGSVFFASEAAAQALLARVQLYNKNYQAAEDAASAALTRASDLFGASLAQPDELSAIFDETSDNPEAIFVISVVPTTESLGINDALSAYTSLQWVAQLPTQDLLETYDPDDARLDAWYSPCFDETSGQRPTGCDEINNFEGELFGETVAGFEHDKYNSEQDEGQFADNHIHFRVAEMKLIQAEARLNGATGDPIAPLNELRNARGLDNFAGTLDIDEILDERFRELVGEGHRFFDLKRLGRDIKKPDKMPAKTAPSDLTFDTFWILDDIPPGQLDVNEALQQNPGFGADA